MKIRGWQIDGFGVFSGYRVDGLGDGLNIFHGLNEAGKSTLLAFLRGVLFGFRDRRSREGFYPPLNGGNHGGRMLLDAGGEVVSVEREAGGRRPPRIANAADEELDETVLRQLLGGADRALFENIFAIGLREVQEPDSLKDDSVRERIFSASVAGAARSARGAWRAFDQRAGEHFNPNANAKNHKVAALLEELREAENRLREARAATGDYRLAVAAEAEKQAVLAALRERIEGLREQRANLERLTELWPRWQVRAAIVERLARNDAAIAADPATPVGEDEALNVLAKEAANLARTLAGQRSELARRGDVEAARTGLAERLERQLAELGGGWSHERLEEFSLTIPVREEIRDWQVRLDGAGRNRDAAADALKGPSEAKRQATADLQETETALAGEDDAPASFADLRARASALEKLRAELSDLAEAQDTAERRNGAVAERENELDIAEAAVPVTQGWYWLVPSGLILLLAAALAVISLGDLKLLAAAGITTLVAAAMGFYHYRRNQDLEEQKVKAVERVEILVQALQELRAGGRQARENLTRQTEKTKKTATELDFPSTPSHAEVTDARNETDIRMDARREWEQKEGRRQESTRALAQASQILEAAERTLAEAKAAHETVSRDWGEWRGKHGFPDSLSPSGVDEFSNTLENGRATLHDLKERERELGAMDDEHESWGNAVRDLLRRRGAVAPADSGEAILAAFEAEETRLHEQLSDRRDAVNIDNEIGAHAFGQAETTAAFRATLISENPDVWAAKIQALDDEIAQVRGEENVLLEDAVRARDAREHLERGTDIAELDSRREGLIAEIRAQVDEWRRLKLASALIENTLSRFEQAHQPAVLAHAGAHFSKITDGRYARIRQRSEDNSFDVINAAGQALDPATELSRGTREQLYFCLRLGLAEAFSRHGADLPLILDDPFVNFDHERRRAIAAALFDAAAGRQILLFTCHDHVVETFREIKPKVPVHEIERRPATEGDSAA